MEELVWFELELGGAANIYIALNPFGTLQVSLGDILGPKADSRYSAQTYEHSDGLLSYCRGFVYNDVLIDVSVALHFKAHRVCFLVLLLCLIVSTKHPS